MKSRPAFSNSSGLKSVFEKLRFCDGLVWTVGITVEARVRFQISLTQRRYCLRKYSERFAPDLTFLHDSFRELAVIDILGF